MWNRAGLDLGRTRVQLSTWDHPGHPMVQLLGTEWHGKYQLKLASLYTGRLSFSV